MLDKKNRLTTSREFSFIFRKGRKYRGDLGMLIAVKDGSPANPPKFGFVVGKKVGNAVKRHLLTRRLRHIVREHLTDHEEQMKGMKFSYIAHSFPEEYNELKNELIIQLDQSINNVRSN